MPFADQQIRQLQTAPKSRHVKQREMDGRVFPYLEGWRAIAEANRIFGFDNWDRETVASDCVTNKFIGGLFVVTYVVRVRITVRAGDARVIRDGCGSAEAFAATLGQAYERAAKAAETDATKRALSTFGAPFGLMLYAGLAPKADKPEKPKADAPVAAAARPDAAAAEALREAPRETLRQSRDETHDATLDEATGLPAAAARETATTATADRMAAAPIDKSMLEIGEPKRRRDPDHLRLVAAGPCLACGRQPSQAHHLRFAQPRALGRKVSDEFVVPLCVSCHQNLHLAGDERRWWRERAIEPLAIAARLWATSRGHAEAAE